MPKKCLKQFICLNISKRKKNFKLFTKNINKNKYSIKMAFKNSIGNWKLNLSGNFDEYMKEIGAIVPQSQTLNLK